MQLRSGIAIPALLTAMLIAVAPAAAHTTSNAFVLLLPTGYYLAGGTLAVALSVAVTFFMPTGFWSGRLQDRLALAAIPVPPPLLSSGLAAAALGLLVAAGFFGNPDPRVNPLPLTVWSLLWVGFTFLQALCGDLWHFCNPWHAPYRLICQVARLRSALIPYPAWLGYWPAVAGFMAIAWFELVDLAPDDPTRLARAVLIYWAVTLTGMVLFGEAAWLLRGEALTVFFRLMATLSPFMTEEQPSSRRRALSLGWPGARLARLDPLPFDGICFVLLTLGTVSFDGFSRTFWWLAAIGINPLEFPGRSAVMVQNTLGLLLLWLLLVAAYMLACGRDRTLAGRLALSIMPIALAYHFAHYLTVLLIDFQYALKTASDPLGLGWDLFGTASIYVTTSFLTTYQSVVTIWNLQAGAIVLGHVIAIVLAQAMHHRAGAPRLAHLPLALLMVLYTLFGLWLMSTPNAG